MAPPSLFGRMAPPPRESSSEASPTVAKTSDSERMAEAEKMASLRRREAELQAELLAIERDILSSQLTATSA